MTLKEENRDTLEEYIKRADVLAKADYDANYRLIITAKDVRNIPRADVVEVKHGRWVRCENFVDIEKCSLCGVGFVYPRFYKYNYCPNCGAKMDGE